ncbi:MAG: DUF4924 family protein [Bacteroidales bacterium]|nr:DUF4924 family protein [Bacteroidales bacterium]
MIIANKKREENIAEYLLYMWQIEDTIRAYNLDIDAIEKNIIDKYQIDEITKKEMRNWYENLIEMMRHEHLEEKGHLQINKNVLLSLSDLHHRLQKSPNESFYTAAFYKALPYIVELRSNAGDNAVGELETCFLALYGILMLRLQGKEISQETIAAIKDISTFLAILAEKYKQDKAGELKLEE